MQAPAPRGLWADETVNMDETVAFPGVFFLFFFGGLCRARVPGGAATASDSMILLLTVQLFSLLPH